MPVFDWALCGSPVVFSLPLALLCAMFSCVSVTFPYGVLGQVWYMIVSIPDICLIPYTSLCFEYCLIYAKINKHVKFFQHFHLSVSLSCFLKVKDF